MSYNMFCLRICISETDEFKAEFECQHEIDLMGCQWVMPGDYTNGTFTDCQGDSAYPPGWYIQPNGSTSTFKQRYTGTNTASGGKKELWTIGVTVTPKKPYMTPSTSQCTTYQTVSNGIPTESLTSGAAFSWTGALPVQPTVASATPNTAGGAEGEAGQTGGAAAVNAAGASGSAGSAKSAATHNYAFVGAVSLVAMLVGGAAIIL